MLAGTDPGAQAARPSILGCSFGEPSDAELLARVRQGAHEAVAEIIKRYGPALRLKIRRCTRVNDVDDICQEVWLRLYQEVPTLTTDNLLGWLLVTARNCCIDEYRKKRRIDKRREEYAQAHGDQLEIDHQTPPRAADAKEQCSWIKSQRGQLVSKRDYDIMERLVADGQSGEEVAREFGLTAENVRKIKSRTLGTLRSFASNSRKTCHRRPPRDVIKMAV
jgi:RNA polymerase sigma factor (sigma-70 family)